MNYIVIKGVLENTPEIIPVDKEYKKCPFTVAVKRKKSSSQQQQYDSIDCIAYNTQAEFLAKYFKADSKIIVEGSLKTSCNEDTNGNISKTYVLVARNISFGANKEKSENFAEEKKENPADEFLKYLDDDSDLPF